jgi:hypothetical protein
MTSLLLGRTILANTTIMCFSRPSHRNYYAALMYVCRLVLVALISHCGLPPKLHQEA